jgi:hypothetical protein
MTALRSAVPREKFAPVALRVAPGSRPHPTHPKILYSSADITGEYDSSVKRLAKLVKIFI